METDIHDIIIIILQIENVFKSFILKETTIMIKQVKIITVFTNKEPVEIYEFVILDRAFAIIKTIAIQ